MKMVIRLSQKHGVNPMIPTCFFCGKPKNEIVLLGRLKGDAEAPMYGRVAGDYQPCDECKAAFAQGVAFFEMGKNPMFENQVPMQENVYPTGRVCVVKTEAAEKMFQGEMLESVMKAKKVFISQEDFGQVFKNVV